jgi:hypothetical protein
VTPEVDDRCKGKCSTGLTEVTGKEFFDMKTLDEMESLCSRILSVLERDDLRSGTLVTLSTMLTRLRSDLERNLVEWHSTESDAPELRSAQESLRTMNGSVLWLQEYAEVKPVVEVSQRLRMASVRALQIIALLQHMPRASMPRTDELPHAPLVSSTSASLAV